LRPDANWRKYGRQEKKSYKKRYGTERHLPGRFDTCRIHSLKIHSNTPNHDSQKWNFLHHYNKTFIVIIVFSFFQFFSKRAKSPKTQSEGVGYC